LQDGFANKRVSRQSDSAAENKFAWIKPDKIEQATIIASFTNPRQPTLSDRSSLETPLCDLTERAAIRFSLRALLISVAAVAAMFAAYFLLSSFIDPFDNQRFKAESWAAASAEDRARMARDVLNRVSGVTRDDVVELLGEPNDRLTGKTDAGGHTLRGVDVFSYCIGSWSMHGMDDAFVYVYFDSTDTVVCAEITGY